MITDEQRERIELLSQECSREFEHPMRIYVKNVVNSAVQAERELANAEIEKIKQQYYYAGADQLEADFDGNGNIKRTLQSFESYEQSKQPREGE